jgi:acylphosphatase
MNERVELRIVGRVQGVWYRKSAQEAAQRRALQGWVRNADDGSVEAVAEGPRAQLEDFIAWCRQGPKGARVDDVKASWSKATGEFEDFSVRR